MQRANTRRGVLLSTLDTGEEASAPGMGISKTNQRQGCSIMLIKFESHIPNQSTRAYRSQQKPP